MGCFRPRWYTRGTLMTSVLIVSPTDLSHTLSRTVLGRRDLVRQVALPDVAAVRAQAEQPRLVLVDASEPAGAAELLRVLRTHPETRSLSLAALVHHPATALEDELRKAGANVVLAGRPVPFLWDQWLQELMSVPGRRALRAPVAFDVWQGRGQEDQTRGDRRLVGQAVNISVRGMLLETPRRLEVGGTLDVCFQLPGLLAPIQAVGLVVREEAGSPLPRQGIKFTRIAPGDGDRIAAFVGPEGPGAD
jgi:hypothetical protein